MKRFVLFLFTAVVVLSCEKDESKSYAYWSKLVSEKRQEINVLTSSVPCTNIEEFDIINKNGYFLVHPSIKIQFNRLMAELEHLQVEASKAAEREGTYIYSDIIWMPNPPVRKVCEDGKPKLIFAQDLTLEEINGELPPRYEDIQNFYIDVPCINASDWQSQFLRTGCCMEGIAVHKSIGTDEILEKIHIYNRLVEVKLAIDKTTCPGGCPNFAKPVQCIDGKPVVELTNQ